MRHYFTREMFKNPLGELPIYATEPLQFYRQQQWSSIAINKRKESPRQVATGPNVAILKINALQEFCIRQVRYQNTSTGVNSASLIRKWLKNTHLRSKLFQFSREFLWKNYNSQSCIYGVILQMPPPIIKQAMAEDILSSGIALPFSWFATDCCEDCIKQNSSSISRN